MWPPRRFVGRQWVSQGTDRNEWTNGMRKQKRRRDVWGQGVVLVLGEEPGQIWTVDSPSSTLSDMHAVSVLKATGFHFSLSGLRTSLRFLVSWGGVLTTGLTWRSGRWRGSGVLKSSRGACLWMCEKETKQKTKSLWC